MNNKLKFFLVLVLAVFSAKAQTEKTGVQIRELPILNMSEGVNIHIISPEPIQFVDLSSNNMIGDLPSENIARIKIGQGISDSIKTQKKSEKIDFKNGDGIGVITIVGQSFMAQYKIIWRDKLNPNVQSNIHIQAEDMQPLEYPKVKFSQIELRDLCLNILNKKKSEKKPIRKVKDLKMVMQLNNVYVLEDYIFMDITLLNNSNLNYDVDGISFSIEDKKIYKATNNQSVEVKPVYRLYGTKKFRKNFRNIYVFKKFTYPNSKVFNIRFFEEQVSGRTIEMKMKYSDVLNADTF
ncbi:DUF4138 domain-containing protein [Riemerella anatipestifer]|uniref:DUF4138 domain-containing protein n=1 Tax=Riemerella anatipestifer TaxID=34085 RepID=A0AAP6HF96_RIEAN|nr:DUF4138 domain-containing protein [Riemerella anatipestifer]MCO7354039.1 conjugative transposon protein TraN [Riemerella anatipestifer]MCU7559130.1 conjugative transposon protein TraN [Riemerella anatipestifer]MCU7571139.1 conjugative transposon protein TraN [Riemerella anatipestifer]MCU7597584.1 conjugative transposon protein TraN [Riemerella anatipestifer]MCW0488327.1 conjugative transposon protein TraN [Riemerella anatipestifer]